MTRVLVIGNYAHSLINFRGALLKEMVNKGMEVFACAPDADKKTKKGLTTIGVHYRDIPLSRGSLNPLKDWQTIMAIKEIIQKERPDRILAYTVKPIIYSSIAARLAGSHSVYSMITGLGYAFGEDSKRQRLLGTLVRKLYRVALKTNSGIFFQNPDDRQLFASQGLIPTKIPVTLINGSGVDLEWYKPQPIPEEPVFLLVARLLEDKGIREYFHAARKLKRQYPHARFQLVGDFDENPKSIRPDELKSWISEGVIEYLGYLEDVRPAYANAMVFVLPSYYREGTPRTVLEAMASGRPIITADAPGCRETINGKNGFLVPVKSSEALADAMEIFIQDTSIAERMGNESVKFACEKYDVRKVNAVIMGAMGL